MDILYTNLTSLYYFKVIAECENMTKAAEQLYVSQPALSKAILKLENTLGVSLFARSKGRIHLTKIGSEYYQYVSAAFSAIEAGNRRIEEYKTMSNEKVTIASSVSSLLNPMVFQFLKEVNPSVQINQFLMEPSAAESKLLSGDLDIVITPVTMSSPDISYVKCAEEEILLVVNKDHPLAAQKTVRLADLKNEYFLVNESSFDKRILTAHCEMVGFIPQIALYSNEDSIINRALHYNMGVSLIPGNVLYTHRNDNDDLVPLRITDLEIVRMIGVATRKGEILSRSASALMEFACRYFEELGKEISEYLDSIFPPVDKDTRRILGFKNIRTGENPPPAREFQNPPQDVKGEK